MDFDSSHVRGTVYACRRSGRRHRLSYAKDAFIEFIAPDGRARRLDLLEISSGGLCFELQDAPPVLEPGSSIDRIVVWIASARIDGALSISHATEAFAAGTICGAQFHPATDADKQKLDEVIAALGT